MNARPILLKNCIFPFKLLSEAHRNDDANFIVSTFSIWSVMLLVAEGASNRTHDQLKQALRLPNDFQQTRSIYKNIENVLSSNTSGIELAVNQAVFTDTKYPLQADYEDTLANQYEADFLNVDFQNQSDAVKTINDYICLRSGGKINDTVKPDDLADTKLLLTSSILFKGKWKVSVCITEFSRNISCISTRFFVLCQN